MNLWLKILISVFAVEALGGMGAAVTSGQIPGWYAGLEKPPGTPPNWVFGPVWITLFAMMGLAFALVWHRGVAGSDKRKSMVWFGVQLVLNLAWTPLFFGLHQMLWALVVIVLLWLAIAVTAMAFRRISPFSALLLVPYWIWVGYASYLNAGYWFLNR